MESLLHCPICGNQPELSSHEPELQSMKYFCGPHVGAGEWEKTKELAVESWNRRVLDYKHWKEQVEIPCTPEFIYAQSMMRADAYCEDCDYETGSMPMKNLIYQISMEGGYIYSDKQGGYVSQCPKCESENLTLGSD